VLQSDPKIWQKQFAHSNASLERWQEQVTEGCRKSDHFLFKMLESLYSTPVCIVAPTCSASCANVLHAAQLQGKAAWGTCYLCSSTGYFIKDASTGYFVEDASAGYFVADAGAGYFILLCCRLQQWLLLQGRRCKVLR
jgi:hypothetical protein